MESLRLFLIEDDDDIALLIRKTLERAGHRVARCRTAADAIIVVSQDSPDLIILDHHLPDMNGLELLERFASEGITAPVLMVTQNEGAHMATRVLHAGALDYLVKDANLAFLTELPKRVTDSVTRHRLQHTNALLLQALESTRDGILITDLQGTIVHVNRALEALTGYSRPELVGNNARLLKSGVHPPRLFEDLWKTILARQSWQGELTNRCKDGSLIEVSLTVSPIVNVHGQLTHFVGIQRDVSERKHLERQLMQAQKMQSVGTLAGGVAHEFNNLLAGISGYAALGLRDLENTKKAHEYYQRILELSDRASRLTRQLLTFARKPALSRQPLNVETLVRHTAEFVADGLKITPALDLPPPETGPLIVMADPNQLQQALMNLALNSKDALEEAGKNNPPNLIDEPLLTFRIKHQVVEQEMTAFPQNIPPGDYVVIEVIDRGAGMTPEVLSRAIDPFFTTKEVGQGTGLGLPMVFGIVQGHQGYLALDSSNAEGTSAALYLPRYDSPPRDVPSVDFQAGQVLEPETTQGKHILVIDDEEAILDIVRRFLEIAGHQVTCAQGGADGLKSLEEGKPVDLVVLDLMMPGEDTATVLERLRQIRPGLPVLLCTGMPHAQPAPELLKLERVSLIRKPFRMNELWYAVNRSLSGNDTDDLNYRA